MELTFQAVVQLLACTGGIYLAYLTQGWVSEQLSTQKYGPNEDHFDYLHVVNGAQFFACFSLAFLLFNLLNRSNSKQRSSRSEPYPPIYEYLKPALSNTLGSMLGMSALKNISYPAHVLAKSSKMVPVMIMGTLIYKKVYKMLEYFAVVLIAIGMFLFAKKNSKSSQTKLAAPNPLRGYTFVIGNLALDGFTNACQDDINRRYVHNHPLHMMCWMNFWCLLMYGVVWGMFGVSKEGDSLEFRFMHGDLVDMVRFCLQHAEAAKDVVLFCMCGALGQVFIFYTIKASGSLVTTTVCTTRKFFSILLSVLLNGQSLLFMQWWGVFSVFFGLSISIYSKYRSKKLLGKHKKDDGDNNNINGEKQSNGNYNGSKLSEYQLGSSPGLNNLIKMKKSSEKLDKIDDGDVVKVNRKHE